MHQWISCFTWIRDLIRCPHTNSVRSDGVAIGKHWHCCCEATNRMPKLCDGKKASQMNYISISERANRNSLLYSLSLVLQVTSSRNERTRSIIAIKFQSYGGQKKMHAIDILWRIWSVKWKLCRCRRKRNATIFLPSPRELRHVAATLVLAANAIRIENVFRSEQTRRWKSFNELHSQQYSTSSSSHQKHAIFASSVFFLFIFDAIIGLHSCHFFFEAGMVYSKS